MIIANILKSSRKRNQIMIVVNIKVVLQKYKIEIPLN